MALTDMPEIKNETIIQIPLVVLNANYDRRGYFDRVIYHYQKEISWEMAWELTEEELQQYGLPNRYKSYKSFHNGRAHYLKGISRKST